MNDGGRVAMFNGEDCERSVGRADDRVQPIFPLSPIEVLDQWTGGLSYPPSAPAPRYARSRAIADGDA
jgi:hypothetical protein